MSKRITLKLSNNQALHLWGILVGYIYDTTNDLKRKGTFKNDGTVKKSRKYFSDFEQEQIDNLAIAELIYKHIEKVADFPKDEL
jgi:hypothetical protein